MSAIRRRPDMSAVERARLLSKFQSGLAALHASDPTAVYRKLHAKAQPGMLRGSWNWPEPLSGLYQLQRRACVLQAWAALQVVRVSPEWDMKRNWSHAARMALYEARRFARLAKLEAARELAQKVFP